MSSRYRLLETPKGNGKVSLGDQALAEARYSLTVRQEFIAADDEVIEHREIDGTLRMNMTVSSRPLVCVSPTYAICCRLSSMPGESPALCRRI